MTKTIVILHGWRLTGSRYKDIQTIFEKKGYTVFSPDLPGSGDVPLQKEVMHIDDYIVYVLKFLEQHKLKKIILIGHSFGGRVSAKLTAQHADVIEKLILTGAPLIKQKLSFKKRILTVFAKSIKKIVGKNDMMRKILYSFLGEWDYYKAPQNIRETFKAIIAEDISPHLPFITVPTLVLWGENDTFVSTDIGKQIAQRIKNAKYVAIPGGSHKLPYEQPEIFAEKVLEFIK
jgi:pimeloyl-ACP methyl ester carboxylesterase